MLRQSLQIACAAACLCALPACTSSTPEENAPVAEESTDSSVARKQPTVLDDQLKALDKARAVEATLEEAKAARDKAIDEAGGG
ncbi:hypothetical protein [Dokdonella sp.]|uniref:hypothetical protein n=1 Tax=Dokdonella sp. TaxID=2291710 RepID=UPI00352990DB